MGRQWVLGVQQLRDAAVRHVAEQHRVPESDLDAEIRVTFGIVNVTVSEREKKKKPAK